MLYKFPLLLLLPVSLMLLQHSGFLRCTDLVDDSCGVQRFPEMYSLVDDSCGVQRYPEMYWSG